jgi:single-strand DNA-binding protein
MPDLITVTGLVATTPKNIVTSSGLAITTFRMASNQRKFDKAEGKWVNGETNWYTITSFRQLAANVMLSLQKGQRIVVTGRLRVRDWNTDDKKGTSVEIDAEALGHDLAWGTAAFTRSAAANLADAESAPDGHDEGDPEPSEAGALDELPASAREAETVEATTPF